MARAKKGQAIRESQRTEEKLDTLKEFIQEAEALSDLWTSVSYTHLRAHETPEHLVCRLLLEKKKKTKQAKTEKFQVTGETKPS